MTKTEDALIISRKSTKIINNVRSVKYHIFYKQMKHVMNIKIIILTR